MSAVFSGYKNKVFCGLHPSSNYYWFICTFVMSLLAEGDKESRDQGGNMEVDIG